MALSDMVPGIAFLGRIFVAKDRLPMIDGRVNTCLNTWEAWDLTPERLSQLVLHQPMMRDNGNNHMKLPAAAPKASSGVVSSAARLAKDMQLQAKDSCRRPRHRNSFHELWLTANSPKRGLDIAASCEYDIKMAAVVGQAGPPRMSTAEPQDGRFPRTVQMPSHHHEISGIGPGSCFSDTS